MKKGVGVIKIIMLKPPAYFFGITEVSFQKDTVAT